MACLLYKTNCLYYNLDIFWCPRPESWFNWTSWCFQLVYPPENQFYMFVMNIVILCYPRPVYTRQNIILYRRQDSGTQNINQNFTWPVFIILVAETCLLYKTKFSLLYRKHDSGSPNVNWKFTRHVLILILISFWCPRPFSYIRQNPVSYIGDTIRAQKNSIWRIYSDRV